MAPNAPPAGPAATPPAPGAIGDELRALATRQGQANLFGGAVNVSGSTEVGKTTATATAALKALLNGAKLDANGKLSVDPNGELTQAQFSAAVKALFGQVTTTGTYDTSGSTLAADFKTAWGSLDGSLAMKDGVATAQLGESLKKVLGPNTLIANNRVVFQNTQFQSATFDDELVTKFGSKASLGTTFKASLDQNGIASATATAAFKALLGNTTLDTSGSELTIKNNTLTDAQFKAAVETVFGPNAKLSGDGAFKWSKDSGLSGDAVAAFKGIWHGVSIDANGAISVKDAKASGTLGENLKAMLGPNTVVANNRIVFQDNAFQSAQLDDALVAKFGASASLKSVLNASLDRSGVACATATAAFKALLGTTKLDANGVLSVADNKLTVAQFGAAVQTLFGQAAVNGTFDTKTSTLAADFKALYGGVSVDAQGTLTPNSASLSTAVKTVLGENTLIANNAIAFQNNAFQTAALDEELVSKFGPNASLTTTLKASLDREGIQTATATAALKAVIGNTTLDTTGSGFTLKNNGLSEAQFKAAVQTLFGPNAKLQANGSFQWSQDSGVSADLVASYQRVQRDLTISTDGTLAVRGGKLSGQLQENLKTLLGNNTLVANNQVLFKDNRFQSADLDDSLTTQFGPKASLASTLKASLDQNGIASANAAAALKTLIDSTTIDTSGALTIKNNTLDSLEFHNALTTLFGPNAKLSTTGTFTWNKDSGASAEAVAAFKRVVDGLSIDANGKISLKDGKVSGELAEAIEATLGKNVIVANNQVVFKDNAFQSATLDDSLTRKFGDQGSLAATFQASVDQSGIASATATAAFKALLGGTTIDTSGTGFTIKNNTLTDAQFKAALATTFGDGTSVGADGTFKWDKDSGLSTELGAHFKKVAKDFTLDTDGNLTLKPDAKVDAHLQATVQAVLGHNTIVANNQVVFQDSRFVSATLNDSLKTKFGAHGSLDATVQATVKQGGLVDATVSLAAFKRLKDLGQGGGIDVGADGSVVIKDNHIDRAEVSALLSTMAGKDVNLGATGKLIYADGKVDPSFGANLKATWDNTTLGANGTLTVVDGKPQVTGQISAMFGGANVKGGASLDITGADSGRLNFKLQQLGGKTALDTTGSLLVDHGRIRGAGLTTNLVTKGDSPANVSLGGLISVTDHGAQASLKTQINAGVVSGGLGVGGSTQTQVYTPPPQDRDRAAVAARGGVWAQHDATFDMNANASAGGTVLVAGVPLTLGFKTDGETKRSVHALTLHASQDDALAQSPITVIHPPTTVDEVLAMRPYEQFSDSGQQSIGIGGNAAVGFGAGPAQLKAGGSMYYQITGNLSRDIERLDGDRVRVRITRGNGSTDIKALTASVGLDAGKLGTDNALAKQAAPLLSQLAQAGVSAKWEKMQEHDTVFDATIDLSTPYGRAALQHLLAGDLHEAQYWASDSDSGVRVNQAMDTDVNAQTQTLGLNLGIATKEDVSRWLDEKQRSLSPKDVTFDEAVDRLVKKRSFFGWNPDMRLDTRFVHETRVVTSGQLTTMGDVTTTGTMQVRVPRPVDARSPTLADSEALLGLRFRLEERKTSQVAAASNIDKAMVIMKAMGFASDELAQIDVARDAVASPLAPKRQSVIPFTPIGDKRFGKTAIDVEGFLGPKGFAEVFEGRNFIDFKNAYLEASAVSGSIVSRAGIREAIEQTLGAQLLPADSGGWDVMRQGRRIGGLTDADLDRVRAQVARESGEGGGYVPEIDTHVGNWVHGRPQPLIRTDLAKWREARDIAERAGDFARTLGEAAELWAQNQPPPQAPGETADAYGARVEAWKDRSLFKKPDVFYAQMDALFRQALTCDSTPTAAIAVMGLAGPDHIYGKAQVELQPDTLKQMIDKGRGNVQRFGAVALLAGLHARVDAKGNVVVPPPGDSNAVAAAVKVLAGDAAAGSSGLTLPLGKQRLALAAFLEHVQTDGNGMRLDKRFEKGLEDALGDSWARAPDGRLVFDNRAYGIVHFGDALSVLGDAMKAGSFPTLVPIQDQGAAQSYELNGLIARHNGPDSHWGDAFDQLAYLHGDNEDLGAKKDAEVDWLLVGAGR
jgi:hypothetical protein